MLNSVVTLLVTGISLTQAVYPNGYVYSRDINHLLTCYERNPFKFLEDESPLRPEAVPLIPLSNVETQQTENGIEVNVRLPLNSSFEYPLAIFPGQLGQPDEARLLNFLKTGGQEGEPVFNEAVTPLLSSRPSSPPPRACEIIPSVRGSGGQEKIHRSEAQDISTLINQSTVPSLVDDTTLNEKDNSEELRQSFVDNRETIQSVFLGPPSDRVLTSDFQESFINNISALCDIWLGKCPLTPFWVELPSNYFPRFFAQGTCSQKNCSLPRGQFCLEDLRYVAYTAVLRWDCCFNPDEDPYRPSIWECGWRKVGIPIVCDCSCGCKRTRT